MDLSTNPDALCNLSSGGWCWPHGDFCDNEVTFDLVGCARCDGDGHPNLTFKKFKLPAGKDDEWTHWATCPVTGEPILMGFFDIDEDEDESCNVCGNVLNKADQSTAFCSFCAPIMIERGLAPPPPIPIIVDESVPEGEAWLTLREDYERLRPIKLGAEIKDWGAVMRLLSAVSILLDVLERIEATIVDPNVTYSSFCDRCGPMDGTTYRGTPMMVEREAIREALRLRCSD